MFDAPKVASSDWLLVPLSPSMALVRRASIGFARARPPGISPAFSRSRVRLAHLWREDKFALFSRGTKHRKPLHNPILPCASTLQNELWQKK